ncbi:MAG: FAD-linked oxidase C-terminal domain-containing protein, partial [Acidovorax sp.]
WRAHCVVATRLCGIATRHSQRLALHPASARHKRDIGNFRIPKLCILTAGFGVGRCWEARALSMAGTCTGEHGVGLHKMGFLLDETGAGAVDMMRTIKRALDPKNILNPGKIFAL